MVALGYAMSEKRRLSLQQGGGAVPAIGGAKASEKDSEVRNPKPPQGARKMRVNTMRNFTPFGDDSDSDDDGDTSAEGKLRRMMMKQKENGMTALKIFQKFPSYFTGSMTKAEFEKGLKSFGKKFTTMEILGLCASFEVDSDHTRIASQKLADFCFSINSMAWKAEKNRNKYKVGDPTAFMLGHTKARPSEVQKKELEEAAQKKVEGDDAKGAGGSGGMGKFTNPPHLIGTSVKLFWKSNDNVEMHYYSNGSVVSIVPWNSGDHKQYATIHIDETKLDEALLSKEEKAEKVVVEDKPKEGGGLSKTGANALSSTLGLGMSSPKGLGVTRSLSPTAEMEEVADDGPVEISMSQKEVDFIAMRVNHAVDKKTGEKKITVNKLSDDKFDINSWILEGPEDYGAGSELERAGKVSMDEFEGVHSQLQKDTEAAGAITKEAEKKANQVRMSLEAFGSLYAAINKTNNWSVPKKRWKKAISTTLMGNLCEKFRVRVAKMMREGKL
ncbi:hypothetical protein TrST_g8000 [Triparma strigata]|uniref:Uncharacterized protein n=1 Tax=Triparma strigata TaxID=1606541 RepID=A0A9W7E5J2_9STRA|nr:hypothetical protein TrST_g8000 [Triparma strigata]